MISKQMNITPLRAYLQHSIVTTKWLLIAARLGNLHDWLALVIKVNRHPISERVLESSSNLCGLIGIIGRTGQRLPIQNSSRELGEVIDE